MDDFGDKKVILSSEKGLIGKLMLSIASGYLGSTPIRNVPEERFSAAPHVPHFHPVRSLFME
jgi:hypothetical protein